MRPLFQDLSEAIHWVDNLNVCLRCTATRNDSAATWLCIDCADLADRRGLPLRGSIWHWPGPPSVAFLNEPWVQQWKEFHARRCMCGTLLVEDDDYACPDCLLEMFE